MIGELKPKSEEEGAYYTVLSGMQEKNEVSQLKCKWAGEEVVVLCCLKAGNKNNFNLLIHNNGKRRDYYVTHLHYEYCDKTTKIMISSSSSFDVFFDAWGGRNTLRWMSFLSPNITGFFLAR